MTAWQKEMKANQEVMEANREEMKSLVEHEEIPK
jgi:hypothetical protein